MKKANGLLWFLLVLAGMTFWIKPWGLEPAGEAEIIYPDLAEGAWEYPVRPGTEEWVNLGSRKKRIEVCQVPREALEEMDTAALLETALDYPFCSDMLVFDRPEDGYRHQLQHNSALPVLEAREDRHEVMQARLEDMREWLDEVGRARSAESAFQYDCLMMFEQCME